MRTCGLRSVIVAVLYFAGHTAYAGDDRTLVKYDPINACKLGILSCLWIFSPYYMSAYVFKSIRGLPRALIVCDNPSFLNYRNIDAPLYRWP
jgi:hypothetical protein